MKKMIVVVFAILLGFGNQAFAEEKANTKGTVVEKFCIEIPYGLKNHPEKIESAIFSAINSVPIEFAPMFWNQSKLTKDVGVYSTEICQIVNMIPLD